MNANALESAMPHAIRALIALALAAAIGSATAATITVNSLADTDSDDGECTLREAIIAANNTNPSGSMPGECVGGELDPVVDRIEFDIGLSGTIMLTSGLPTINDPIEIIGPGATDLVIDGGGIATRAFRVTDDTLLDGLTIANTNSGASGGAINANQPLTLRNVVIEGNQATDGGGVYTTTSLTVENCIFRDNTATDFDGGAIRLADAAQTLIVRDSLFENNRTLSTARDGGAIQVGGSDHVTIISGSTFSGNVVESANRRGGAIRIGGDSLTITNSTFTGNSAGRDGGAIYSAAVNSILINVTASDNVADASDDGNGDGGGVYSFNTMTLRNSLLANNTDSGGEAPDCGSSVNFDSDGFNLIGNGTGCFGMSDGVNGDQVGNAANPIDPLLEPLGDNGGPTPTRALLPASPAIDAGNPAGCTDAADAPLTVDQRDRPRPTDGDGNGNASCDTGAFELAADLIFADRFED